ncbi:MAG: L,D-transpeptidase [Clostridia bacterium]|nr:L,D-transpeptidase [Clostridia bacterium]
MTKPAVSIALPALLCLFLLAAAPALALELQVGTVTPFDPNPITVISSQPGTLTITAVSGVRKLENPVTDLPVEAGETGLTWQGLTFGGEPVAGGPVTLEATVVHADGSTETAAVKVQIRKPRVVVVSVLPSAQAWYPDKNNKLKIDVTLSRQGHFFMELASAGKPDEVLWRCQGDNNTREPSSVLWNGRLNGGKTCPAGEYILTAYSRAVPDIRQTHSLTILEAPLPEPEFTVSSAFLPEDLTDDAAVWEALMAPVVVGIGGEGKGLHILRSKTSRGDDAGTVNCRTVGLVIREICEDGWVLVGAWRQKDGAYVEGYIKRENLTVVRPNTHYGVLLDKKNQTITVYEEGKPIGTAQVSTGLVREGYSQADSRSGVYLVGTRMSSFRREGYCYDYPLRIDGANLIHQIGYRTVDGVPNFTDQIAELGQKASHGCIRVDMRVTEENGGINAWWIWTHLERNTKIIVTEDDGTPHYPLGTYAP